LLFGGAVKVFSILRSQGFGAVGSKRRNFEIGLFVQWFYRILATEKVISLRVQTINDKWHNLTSLSS
jgi:hypothetical protein